MKKANIIRFVSAAFMALVLAATALAYTPVTDNGNYNKGPSVENTKATPAQPADNTGIITSQTTKAQFGTTVPITGANLAPDGNTGYVAATNAGNPNPMTFREAARFKDVLQTTGTPPDNILMIAVTKTEQIGVPFDNVRVMAVNKTDANGAMNPPDEIIMTAANAHADNWMKIQTTARGSSGTTDEVGMADNAEAANAHDGTVAAGYTAGFAGSRINANFNTNRLACAGFQA